MTAPATPRRIRCYDNGGETCDRYTVVYLDWPERQPNIFAARGMSGSPFHPQGFGQFTSAMPGKHLGKRIAFQKLPADCQKLVRQDLKPDCVFIPSENALECYQCGQGREAHT